MLQRIKIKHIKPNPFRNIERYPIREEKVAALIQSFKETGIWPVILARQVGSAVEIPFGHHRKTAWDRMMKPSDEIEVNIMELSDTDMLKMMAHENMEEWGTSAIVEIETVAAVVKAYADGKIELNGVPKDTGKGSIRYAPSFILSERSPERGQRPYVAHSVATFLGWTQPGGKPQEKVYTALAALQLIEEGILTEDDFLQLTSNQADKLVTETRARKEEREREAKESEQKAAEARERLKQASTLHEKRLAQEQEKYAQERAEKSRKRGKEEAKQVGKHLASGMREGRIAAKQASAEASKIIGLPKQERELRGINTAARQMIVLVDKILSDDKARENLNLLVIDAQYIDFGVRDALIGSLEGLADRALVLSRKLKNIEIKTTKTTKRIADA